MTLSVYALLALWSFTALCASGSEKDPLVGSLVRSDQWHIHREGKKTEEFIGHVSYRRLNRSIKAQWALYDHGAKRWQARGQVEGKEELKNGENVLVEGQRAEYDRKTDTGFLVGKGPGDVVHLTHQVPGSLPDKATGERLSWDYRLGLIRLEGHTHGQGPDRESWAESATYHRLDKRLVLKGHRPVVKAQEPKWSGAVQADTITGFDSPRRLLAQGQARGWFYLPPSQRGKQHARTTR